MVTFSKDFLGPIYDAHSYYGTWADRGDAVNSAGDVKEVMDKGLDSVFLTPTYSLTVNTEKGNREVLEIADQIEGVFPVAVVPGVIEGTGGLDFYLDEGVKVFRINSLEGFPFPDSSHPWLEELAGKKVLVTMKPTPTELSTAYAVIKNYRSVPFLLAGLNYPQLNYTLQLFQALDNVYLETSGFQLAGGIEYLCNKLGPERLIFGTNTPVFATESNLIKLYQADVSRGDKELIASKNLQEILGGEL